MTHPFAIPGNNTGALGMSVGDRVRFVPENRTGVVDEFLSDGDAYVTWDDGTFGVVRWTLLAPAPATEEGR